MDHDPEEYADGMDLTTYAMIVEGSREAGSVSGVVNTTHRPTVMKFGTDEQKHTYAKRGPGRSAPPSASQPEVGSEVQGISRPQKGEEAAGSERAEDVVTNGLGSSVASCCEDRPNGNGHKAIMIHNEKKPGRKQSGDFEG